MFLKNDQYFLQKLPKKSIIMSLSINSTPFMAKLSAIQFIKTLKQNQG